MRCSGSGSNHNTSGRVGKANCRHCGEPVWIIEDAYGTWGPFDAQDLLAMAAKARQDAARSLASLGNGRLGGPTKVTDHPASDIAEFDQWRQASAARNISKAEEYERLVTH